MAVAALPLFAGVFDSGSIFAFFFFPSLLGEDKGSPAWVVGEKVGGFTSCGSGVSMEGQLWLALFTLLMLPFPICSMGIT